MASRMSIARQRDLLPRKHAVLVGDPVDVATGSVVTSAIDDDATGVGLVFERRYVSGRSHRDGPLGFGWSHAFDQSISLEVGRVVLHDDGREIEFDCNDLLDRVARAGDVLHDATGTLALTSHGHHAWELNDGETTRHFVAMPGTSSADRDRGLSKLSTIVRPNLPLIELHYDDDARLQSVRVDGQAVFALRYDSDGHVESLGDRVARYRYSAAGDLIEAIDLDGVARVYEYENHLLVRETNRNGGAFYYGYDGHDAGARCVRTWGDEGRLHRILSYESGTTLVTDSLGERWIYEVSPLGLILSAEDPLGATTHFSYDDALRLNTVRHPDKTSARDFYDDEGRWVKRRDRDGAIWQMEYDDGGRLTTGVDPQGGRWVFSYDLNGKLARVDDPDNHTTRLEYERGRLSKIIDPLGQVTRTELGPHDELLALDAPNEPAVRFEYDPSGHLQHAVTASGDESRWYYDASGRLVGAMRGGILVQWRRDPEGYVVQRHTEQRLDAYRRDAFGRVVCVSGEGPDLTFAYDSEDRCVSAAVENGVRIDFEHDARGRVSSYAIDGETIGEILHENQTGLISQIQAGGATQTMTWDGCGRLLSCEDTSGKRTFEYREDGLLMSFSAGEHSTTLERNSLGVVLEQTYGETKVLSRDVDYRGNRYGVDIEGGVSISYLWSSSCLLERIAVVADAPFEIDLETAADGARTVARHGNERAEYSFRANGAAEPIQPASSDVACDGLLRPLVGEDGAALIWDEGRLLGEGEIVHLCGPPSDRRLASIEGESLMFASRAEEKNVSLGDTRAAIAKLGLDGSKSDDDRWFGLRPATLLQGIFSRRVWDPRPAPSEGAWNPDAWTPPSLDPEMGHTRLDAKTLMRLLSPFPRPELTVPSAL